MFLYQINFKGYFGKGQFENLYSAISTFEKALKQVSATYARDESENDNKKWRLLSFNKHLTRDWANVHPIQVQFVVSKLRKQKYEGPIVQKKMLSVYYKHFRLI